MARRQYEQCKHIQRTVPEYAADESLIQEIGRNYRTLPTFEKSLYEHLYIKHYSLQRNELLKCRWNIYKDNLSSHVIEPFQFPNLRHLHFQNGAMRYLPSESIHERPDHNMKLSPGPGVDSYGQMPIPQELLMSRGKKEKTTGRIIKSANKKKWEKRI